MKWDLILVLGVSVATTLAFAWLWLGARNRNFKWDAYAARLERELNDLRRRIVYDPITDRDVLLWDPRKTRREPLDLDAMRQQP